MYIENFLIFFRASKIQKSLVNLNKAKDCHYLKTLHLNFIPYWLNVSFLSSRKFLHKSLKKIAALINLYDYHLLGWAYEPSKRPTFQTLKIDLCDILHTEQVKSSSNSSSKSPFTFSEYIWILYLFQTLNCYSKLNIHTIHTLFSGVNILSFLE